MKVTSRIKHSMRLIVLFSAIPSVLVFCQGNIDDDNKDNRALPVSQNTHKHPIVLDPGHGGTDHGTQVAEIYEDEFAYDISVRLRILLIKAGYEVHQTVYDKTTGFRPQITLNNNCDEYLVDKYGNKSDPSNPRKRGQLIEKLFEANSDPQLISIHVNSVHPFALGACVFYPDANIYRSKESEAKSRELAEMVIGSFVDYEIPTYSIEIFGINLNLLKDVRNNFNKGGSFRLAIFDETSIKSKVLIECGNLRNKGDLANLLNPKKRQNIAHAVYKGILQYNGQK